MGNQKQKWTAEEEQALLAGIAKHGPGKWKNILQDPEFAHFLTHRSNIDLKDKWRNLNVSTASQGLKEKSRNPISKAIVVYNQNSSPATSLNQNPSVDNAIVDDSNGIEDGKNTSRYTALVLEALSTIKDANGPDLSAIMDFMEQRHKVPSNFRRLIGSRLRRLISQGKVEKVQNCYKLKKEISLGTKTPIPKQKDIKQRLPHRTGFVTSMKTVEEAAKAAAYYVSDAENKSFLAADAVKEAEKISKMAEDADSMLLLVKELYEQCCRGEVVLVA